MKIYYDPLQVYPKWLIWLNRFNTIVTEGFLLFCQWKYALFFWKKKREKHIESEEQIPLHSKIFVGWIVTMILINTLNFLAYNIAELYISIRSQDSESSFLKTWEIFSLYWYDLVNFSNGLSFLLLFRSMALSQRNKRTTRFKKNKLPMSVSAVEFPTNSL